MYPPTGKHVPTVLTPSQAWYQIDPDHFKKINTWKKRFPSTPETNSVEKMQPYLEGIRTYTEKADYTHEAHSFIFALESCLKVHIEKHDHEGKFKLTKQRPLLNGVAGFSVAGSGSSAGSMVVPRVTPPQVTSPQVTLTL